MGDWAESCRDSGFEPKRGWAAVRQMLGEKVTRVIMKLTLEVSGVEPKFILASCDSNHTVVDRPSGSYCLFGVGA